MVRRLAKTASRWVNSAGSYSFLGFYLLGSLLMRLPFFFRDYVDRDESTFILVAQTVVDGHLPYAELWDLKPPLLFWIFSLPIALFGKSLLAIRILGWLAAGLISFFTFRLTTRAAGREAGFAAGLFCMFLMSLFNSVQGVMSEHLSMVFLLPALLLLIRGGRAGTFLLAGVLAGMAVLCKSNLMVALLILGLSLLAEAVYIRNLRALRLLALTALGGGLTVLASFWPYLAAGQESLWWDSVVRAPLAYSGQQEGVPLKNLPFYLGVGAFLILGYRRGWLKWQERSQRLVLYLLAGILLAFLKGGKLNGHYLLQFYPVFLVLLFAGLHMKVPSVPRFIGTYFWGLLLLLPVESYLEYGNVIGNYRAHGRLYNGEGVEVPEYMKNHHPGAENVLFLEYHIGYWLMDLQPPSPALTHPTNICRGELYPFIPGTQANPAAELRMLFERRQPEWVVCRDGKPAFAKWYPEENHYVESYLDQHYCVEARVGQAAIYKRL